MRAICIRPERDSCLRVRIHAHEASAGAWRALVRPCAPVGNPWALLVRAGRSREKMDAPAVSEETRDIIALDASRHRDSEHMHCSTRRTFSSRTAPMRVRFKSPCARRRPHAPAVL
jgi:hypothetical protein